MSSDLESLNVIVERYYVIFASVTVEKKSGTEQRERARGSRERAEKKFKIWSEKKKKKKKTCLTAGGLTYIYWR